MSAEWDGWKAKQVMTSLNIFVGSLDATMIEWLLCRTEVESIEVDSVVSNTEIVASADESSKSDEVCGGDDVSNSKTHDDAMKAANEMSKQFAAGMTINTGLQLKGNAPFVASPINPATWQSDFDRSTARPKTSRKVSCPTPVQRDDYVCSPSKARRVKRNWATLHEEYDDDGSDDGKEYAPSAPPPPTTDDRSADLSRVESCVSALNNPTSSADFILSVFKRVEVLLAILMGTRHRQFSREFTSNIKAALVAGHVTTAVDCYRTALRVQVSNP